MKHFPAQMQQLQWLEPHSLELTSWTRFLRKRNILGTPTPFLPIDKKELNRIVSSVAQIRHHAVHRKCASVQFIISCLQDAIIFAGWHQQSLVVAHLGSILQRYRDVLEQSHAEEQRLSLDLETSVRLIETMEEKRKERAKGVFKEQRELIRAQVSGLVADLIPQTFSTPQILKNEKQASEDAVKSASYESMLIPGDQWEDKAPADSLSAHGISERVFTQRGCWQLRRYAKTLEFKCASCHAPKLSGLVANPVDNPAEMICNGCYGHLLADWKRTYLTQTSDPPNAETSAWPESIPL